MASAEPAYGAVWLMSELLVDTNVVSYLFKEDSRARLYWPKVVGRDLVLSFMTIAELSHWALRRRWGKTSRERLQRYLDSFIVHFADDELCALWAEVVYSVHRKGSSIGMADAWIAATALALDLPLVTHNPIDFAGVDGLIVITEKSR